MKNLIAFAFLLFAFACANESDPTADKANFTRIYDNDKFNTSYYPIDMRQTADGGFLILGGRRLKDSNFSGAYIMKVDEFGAYVTDLEVDSEFINPVGRLLEVNGKFYFFCMTSVGLQTQLMEMDADGILTQSISVGGSYPSVAAQDNSSFILLSYENSSKESVVSVVSPSGSISKSKSFSIGAGDAVEEPIINHFLRTGTQLPFQVGKATSGQYYFNGFYNYTLSLVFTDLNADDPLGVVQGQQDDGGLSQIVSLEGSKFATSRFNFGDNYFIPNATLNTTGVSSSVDLGGNSLPELTTNAPVKILSTKVNSQDMLLYASNTKSKQIALFGYDKASGEFKGSYYLGFSNPFEIASLIPTADGGLAVCGTTYVAGRFPRICLFKLSQEKLSASFNK
jgi:hypothetical protein